jgi:hypothetical protein
MGQRKGTAADQLGDLLGIDLVVLGFAAMDRLHVERVSQNKGDFLALTEISEPITGEDALDTHNEVFPIGRDQLEESAGLCRNILMETDFSLII